MVVLKSSLLNKFLEISFGFSTKLGLNRRPPYHFNMSLSVDDDSKLVKENRAAFFSSLGLSEDKVAFQKQVHEDGISIVDKGGLCGESDAIITSQPGVGIAVSSADCPAIFIYDTSNKIIAGVHSGWRSSEKLILKKTLTVMKNSFNSKPENLVAYHAPSISGKSYEVGKEVADRFDKKFISLVAERYYLDLPFFNYNIMIEFGLKKENIQISNVCTFVNKELLHSYRREGLKSGRALGVIAMKGKT